MPRTARPIEIHKFGGASLANGAAIAQAVAIIRARRPAPMVVVVSAMAGVTDALLDLAAAAIQRGPDGARATVEALCAQHLGAVRALLGPGPRTDELVQTIEHAFAEVEPLAAGLRILRELTPRTTDYLVARGEQLSARIVAAALDCAGCPATYVDAAAVIQTDGTFGNASPDLARTERSARHVLQPLLARGVVPVVPGFLGAAPDGQVGTLGVPGIAARAFAAVHHEGISISLISQASSEQSICFSVPEEHAERARKGLAATFRREIARQEIDRVEVRAGAATLVVVGLGMAGTPGIAARIFSALAEAKINVIAIAQGSSELNLSLVVDGGDAARALRAVHAAFQLSKIGGGMGAHPERSDVVLLGFGQIGRTLAPLIAKVKQNALRLQVVGLVDRSGFVFDPRGLPPRRLAALAAAKAKATPLAKVAGGQRASATEAVTFVASHALSNPILVDVTAADTTETLKTALAAGMHVVLANKRPITVSRKHYDELQAAAEAHGRQLLREATVGAGLPIIDTFAKLVESGDRVQRIEGCPSGTLGYLFGELGRGRRFSEALRGAMAKGYPEPDPREDLSGMDVARKALILGRLLGFPGELRDVAVESLVPKGAERLPLAEFLARLEQYDAPWTRRVALARQRGGVVRYRAIVTRRRIRVGLVVVDASSPMASLNGTDNQFIFTTMRYRKNPLVITGPGAGPAVTAGGILNDVLKLASA